MFPLRNLAYKGLKRWCYWKHKRYISRDSNRKQSWGGFCMLQRPPYLDNIYIVKHHALHERFIDALCRTIYEHIH